MVIVDATKTTTVSTTVIIVIHGDFKFSWETGLSDLSSFHENRLLAYALYGLFYSESLKDLEMGHILH